MSIKKMALLASMALALVAFAAPATASALEWKHEEKKLGANANLTFTGPVGFTSSFGNVTCETAHGAATIKPGDTGTINSFDGTNCKGSGLLAGCTVVHDDDQGTPWAVKITGSKTFSISGIQITNQFTGFFCPVSHTTLEGNITATVDNAGAIGSATLSGTLNSSLGTVTVNGTLTAQGEAFKTYGIG
jgi:hypothetical protein